VEETLKTTKTVFTVSQFLDWQRQKTLVLKPIFQRRPVWKGPAKSLLIDSVVRGFPVPVILLRLVQDLEQLSMKMEVVDGQQRLRTLLAFIDPGCLPDFDQETDTVIVRKAHNSDIAGRPFAKLPFSIKQALLGYELSTHVFPATTGDELVFRIFARLNSTGLSLTSQEIRNAEFHGAFKSLVYELSFQNFDNWRKWKVFPNSAIARMDEAEAVSEYILAFIWGITGKNQKKISDFYRDNEDDFPCSDEVRQRFEATIGAVDRSFGDQLPGSAFQRPALFYSLFTALYHHLYGLGSPLKKVRPKQLPPGVGPAFQRASTKIRAKDLPEKVQDAMDKATGDKARRDQRHRFIMRALKLEPAV
jgi:Protein of unknown function DUF262